MPLQDPRTPNPQNVGLRSSGLYTGRYTPASGGRDVTFATNIPERALELGGPGAVGPETPPVPSRKQQLDFVDTEIQKTRADYEKQLKLKEQVEGRALQYRMGDAELQQVLQEMGLDKLKEPKIPEYLNKARLDLMGEEEAEKPTLTAQTIDRLEDGKTVKYQLNPETNRYDIKVGEIASKGRGARAGAGAIGFKDEQGLRKEFLDITKPFRTVRDSFARVQASSKEPSAAGDLALIFNYMKMLDPGSVVRESEFAQAAATGAWGERFKAAGLRMLEGERLSPVMRKDFVSRAGSLMKRQKAQFGRNREEYTRLAKEYEIPPSRVIVELEDPLAAGVSLEQDFPDQTSQIQQALKAGYDEQEIRDFLGAK